MIASARIRLSDRFAANGEGLLAALTVFYFLS